MLSRPAAHREFLKNWAFRCAETTAFDCHRVERTSLRAGVQPAEVQRLFSAHCFASNRQTPPHIYNAGCFWRPPINGCAAPAVSNRK